jgi:phage-related protein
MDESARWSIAFYQDARGRRPVEQWLDSLDDKERARVFRHFDLLAEHGTTLSMPYARHLRAKLFELRVPASRMDFRVLYFAASGRQFILLHAFAKQTGKTPAREIDAAERRMADYESRTNRRE